MCSQTRSRIPGKKERGLQGRRRQRGAGPGSWVVAVVDAAAAAAVDLVPPLSCCPSRPCARPHSREPAVIGSQGTGTVAVKQRLWVGRLLVLSLQS